METGLTAKKGPLDCWASLGSVKKSTASIAARPIPLRTIHLPRHGVKGCSGLRSRKEGRITTPPALSSPICEKQFVHTNAEHQGGKALAGAPHWWLRSLKRRLRVFSGRSGRVV